MKEVTGEEFYHVIGPQNVTPYAEGPWPYTSLFKTPSGEVRGKIVKHIPEGEALPVNRYMLPD